MTATTSRVASALHETADLARHVDPPADPDQALDLVAAAVEADKEFKAMCLRIAAEHAVVREQWRQFDPAGMPPPGGGRGGCLSALVSPRFWFRVIKSHRSPATLSPFSGGASRERSASPANAETAPGQLSEGGE